MNIQLNRTAQTAAAAAAALIITWVMSWGFVDATRVVKTVNFAESITVLAASDVGSELLQAGGKALLK